MKEVYCEECKEEFEDGEIVGFIGKEIYHYLFEESFKKKFSKIGMYYQNKIYDVFDIVKLKNFKALKGGLNEKRNGVKIFGNLEDLVNEKPLFVFA